MNVLFIISRDFMLFHGSRETETNILRTGFQLAGIEFEVAGDSRNVR